MSIFVEHDKRPKKRGWAPGYYQCSCVICKQLFVGDKRAVCCAECAYRDSPELLEGNE